MVEPAKSIHADSNRRPTLILVAFLGAIAFSAAIVAFGPASVVMIDWEPGDRVWIRGRSISEGQTRVWPPGELLIHVEKDNFEPMDIPIRARPWRREVVTWPLVHHTGTLVLQSNPPGAQFLIDIDLVPVPAGRRVTCWTGRVTVQATWALGESASLEIDVARDQTIEISADLATRTINVR